MIKYEVGKEFPFPHPNRGAELCVSDISTSFFDVKCYLNTPSSEEIKDFKKGKMTIGVYVYDNCPFVILNFKNWNLDVSINVLKIKSDDQRNEWLNTKGNIINLYLIDSNSNVLKAMRTVSVNFSEDIRDILEKQTESFDNVQEVEIRIEEIQHLTTAEMFSRVKYKQTF